MRIARPPRIEKELPEAESGGLRLLGGSTVRGLELTFDGAKTNILISSGSAEDMQRYQEQLESVYGEMAMEAADEKPPFLNRVPGIAGL
jgi:hypothetical protein